MKAHALYLCYFGLREPLVQTQVLPYLRQIAADGIKVSLLTFEADSKNSWSNEKIEEQRAKLSAENIHWHSLAYHKSPTVPATFYDALNGARFAIKLARREKVDVFHARVHVAALMGAIAKKFCGGKLLFDIRGFMPEEYTDAGRWKENGRLYKSVKRVENHLMDVSDAFVVLTDKAKEILFPGCLDTDERGRPFEVIPCCIDPERFQTNETSEREHLRRELKIESKKVIVYVGSFGGWYMTDEMIRFFAQAKRRDSNSFALILTQSEKEPIIGKLLAEGLGKNDFWVGNVSPAEVPRYLRAADIALSFIKACYSKQSSSPTKIAEYLASGLPIVSNSGVGDLDDLISGEKVGVIVHDFKDEDFAVALSEIEILGRDSDLRERCQKVAWEKFDLLKVGGSRYRRIYRRLLQNRNDLN